MPAQAGLLLLGCFLILFFSWHFFVRPDIIVRMTAQRSAPSGFHFEAPPDTRHPKCFATTECLSIDCTTRLAVPGSLPFEYTHALPPVSIIIPFRNESLNNLQRSVASILALTPECLLGEIILVSSSSII
jgi:cellulose synthase/poly-beta-1,6-N-acetylglucosamine synthase-like glycosyltransferase